ncbi:hypothetical protein DY000_02003370 [Brassica cretica]|uniref:Replication factor A C-terminal domain-containing protein n=1 Tax=Brassica cretica TaxID=69181 RepID=A0ABQ7C6Z9_BRACR|nr:hypothetical protein DY000_02003370 [Brassica cretica]
MNSNSKSPISGDLISKKPNGKEAVSSAGPTTAMDSSTKSHVSGDLIAKKPNGKDIVSSAEPVNRDGQTGVSIATDVSGDPKKTKPNGKAVVSSAEPIRHTGQTGGSCANAVSGDLIPKKSNGKAVVSSAGTIKHSGGSGVPSAKTDEVLFFKDVKFGPQEGELRFRLIHFREARNALMKILIGLEMLLIDKHDSSHRAISKKPNGKEAVSSAGPTTAMDSSTKSHVSGDLIAKKPNGKDIVSSAEPVNRDGQTGVSIATDVSGDPKKTKPNGKAVVSSAEPIRHTGQTGGSCANAVSGDLIPKKSNGKAVVSSAGTIKHSGGSGVPSAKTDEVLFFKDVKFGPQEGELRFRLIHFREARNALMKILIGLEMLLIDEQGTLIQGFIPLSRIDTYLPHMIAGSIYRLNKFYGSKSKIVYRVAEPDVTIAFSWNYVLSDFEDSPVQFPEDRFRFYGYEEFEAACDLKGDLYDYVGHMKLVNGQTLNDNLVLDEVEIASTWRILVHVQTNDGPVMKLYLWDKAATDFCMKFKAHGNTLSVILVTTVNPKRFGGALALPSLSSSRVFFDMDVQPTRDYLTWLSSNSDVANMVNAEIVTKAETVTIGELFSYIKQEGEKVAWFECTATIDGVVHGSAWYYIACGGCKTKATKGPTTLMCKKCGKAEVAGISRSSLYMITMIFVLIGDVGRELTGKPASELVESYFEADENVGDDHVIPVPQALLGTIGQTHKFIVKVSKHNLEGKTLALTVTKLLPSKAPAPEGNLEENVIVHSAEETLQMGNREDGPSIENEEAADEVGKRGSDGIESVEAKCAKCG